METEEIPCVEKHPGSHQALEVDALDAKLEQQIHGDPQVVAVLEEGRSCATTQGKVPGQGSVRPQSQVKFAHPTLDPIRAKTKVDRSAGGSGQGKQGKNGEQRKYDANAHGFLYTRSKPQPLACQKYWSMAPTPCDTGRRQRSQRIAGAIGRE